MLEIGEILGGRYEILKRIGSGGMADVYMAKDQKLNRKVAVKVLKPEYVDDEKFFKEISDGSPGDCQPDASEYCKYI